MFGRHSNITPCLEMKTDTVQKSSASGTFHVLFFSPLFVHCSLHHSTNPLSSLSVRRNESATWFNRQKLVSVTSGDNLCKACQI